MPWWAPASSRYLPDEKDGVASESRPPMRLRELEIPEKVVVNSKLNILLGDKGLADRVVNVL